MQRIYAAGCKTIADAGSAVIGPNPVERRHFPVHVCGIVTPHFAGIFSLWLQCQLDEFEARKYDEPITITLCFNQTTIQWRTIRCVRHTRTID